MDRFYDPSAILAGLIMLFGLVIVFDPAWFVIPTTMASGSYSTTILRAALGAFLPLAVTVGAIYYLVFEQLAGQNVDPILMNIVAIIALALTAIAPLIVASWKRLSQIRSPSSPPV